MGAATRDFGRSRRRLGDPAGIREVEVLPPSRRDETTWVLLAAGLVVLAVIYVVAFERFGALDRAASGTAAKGILPFQVLFRDLPSERQRVFRSMQEGAVEAVSKRGSAGRWPSVEELAAEGIPPFASDPLDRSGLRWEARNDGLLWQYVGIPARTGDPAYLVSIAEPEPVSGEKPVPGVVDEEHQLLPDGRLLHVTHWTGEVDPGSGPVVEPALRGWKQVRVTSAFEEMERRSGSRKP
ncbi:MAG: DUF6162 family protein [Alphaproteobacteria bacterium]